MELGKSKGNSLLLHRMQMAIVVKRGLNVPQKLPNCRTWHEWDEGMHKYIAVNKSIAFTTSKLRKWDNQIINEVWVWANAEASQE